MQKISPWGITPTSWHHWQRVLKAIQIYLKTSRFKFILVPAKVCILLFTLNNNTVICMGMVPSLVQASVYLYVRC